MKKNIVTGLLALALTGCVGSVPYAKVQQTTAPVEVTGVWISSGPQSSLPDPQATASLIVSRSGETLDCREWQRTLTHRGKLAWNGSQLYNVNIKDEYSKISVSGDSMRYGKLTLHRAPAPSAACQPLVKKINGDYLILDQSAPPSATPSKGHKKAGGIQRKNKKD